MKAGYWTIVVMLVAVLGWGVTRMFTDSIWFGYMLIGIGFVGALSVGMVGWRRGRKARSIALSNRESLLESIMRLAQSGTDCLQAKQRLADLDRNNPHFIHVEEMNTEERCQRKYETAKASLERERIVAGQPFFSVIDGFVNHIDSEIKSKTELISGEANIRASFREAAEKTSKAIGDIISSSGKGEEVHAKT